VITQGTQNIPAFPCRSPGVTAQDAVIYQQMAAALMPGGAGPLGGIDQPGRDRVGILEHMQDE